ncbi:MULTISPECIES: hypothetical protein [unclassified Roseateles]|uniref:hypothetical protein n=1 Tax=unclassified Roseateles TaxID=2626991 RepID=UPI000701F3D8|nr:MULTISPECIES: hypothetical protein [unclassified Roseateles]KQW46481.1 hypothetical protein ASC81_08750 [Pelomonas sp. Root405]KRA73532.1 hypothetical protein ASD88_08750 [Pelomonas sp. Root662]
MKRCCLLLLSLLALPAAAAPPAVQLLVELRWVDSQLPAAAQAAVRDGAVVVGTAGAVSPRGPGVVTSTAQAAPEPGLRLQVHNGQRASMRLTTREPLQWVDPVVEVAPTGTVRGVYVNPQPRERRAAESFAVKPTWPGGRAPVRVEFSVAKDGGEFQSTLDLPLDRWQTVARRGGAAEPAGQRGTVSSRDAVGQPERELQLRVSVQP